MEKLLLFLSLTILFTSCTISTRKNETIPDKAILISETSASWNIVDGVPPIKESIFITNKDLWEK